MLAADHGLRARLDALYRERFAAHVAALAEDKGGKE